MNIQQLRYVVAIANSGTFREAASKLFVSQPSLSVAIKDLEQELNFKIFTRTTTGAVLTSQGMTFYERALEVVRSFDSFENRYLNASEKGNQFSISSQHYDFLPPLITTFSERYPDYKDLRIFESTTVQILDEVAKGQSEIGIIYLNRQNSKGIQQNMDKLGLESINLIPFKTHIYLRKGHPLATLNGILERTDAYATASGFLDAQSVNGITVIPLEDNLDNKMVYVRRKGINLSSCALKFVNVMFDYFDTYKP